MLQLLFRFSICFLILLNTACTSSEQNTKPPHDINALLQQAEQYQRAGHAKKSLLPLKQVLESTSPVAQQALLHGSLGQSYFLNDQAQEAEHHLKLAVELAGQAQRDDIQALALLNLGILLSGKKAYRQAQQAFHRSATLARKTSKTLLALKSEVNLITLKDTPKAEQQLKMLLPQLQVLPAHREKLYLYFKVLKFARQANWQIMNVLATQAFQVLQQVKGEPTLAAQALGEIGLVYKQAQDIGTALKWIQQARFQAQQLTSKHLFYRWSWQAGHLLAKQGKLEQAIMAYREAVFAGNQVRHAKRFQHEDCRFLNPDNETDITTVFYEFADLLLRRAATNSKTAYQDRIEARNILEQLKITELDQYFGDECTVKHFKETLQVDEISEQTAVLYPILLQDRLELLLSLPKQGIAQFSIHIPKSQVHDAALRLRAKLENEETNYLADAQKLYSWLIQPLSKTLDKNDVHTLVLIPDATLRQIPLSVLHTGQAFLIEQYAVAITPALTITTPKSNTFSGTKKISTLVASLSKTSLKLKQEDVSDLLFAGLEQELLQKIYPQATMLKDEFFTHPNLKTLVSQRPYELIHISSHAQFSMHTADTYIVLYDDKLNLDALENLIKHTWQHKQNLELLTLSACETAKGNEKAALGLSGVALKAGAHSALASLWKVDEAVALELTQGFYQAFQNRNTYISKAQALQKVQINMVRKGFQARNWAAFLLIGNWL